MTLESLLIEFRYIALVIGLLLEGEAVLLLAAFLAQQGYLQLPVVILLGFLVTFTVDQFFFWIGHKKGKQFLASRPNWALKVEKAKSLLAGNINLLFLGFRFMYGLRIVLPVMFGMSGIQPKRFVVLNFISAVVWSLLVGIAGYLFGYMAETLLADVHKYELWVVLGILIIGGGIWLYNRYAQKVGVTE
jgi:membrane protein DedA with SNARE-associated domain